MRYSNNYEAHWLSLERLTPRQCLNIKNRINEIFSSFDPFNKEFSPGDKLINIFPSCFSFYFTNKKSKESLKTHICKLNNIILQASADPKSVVVISDASIKNQVATSITHIHVHDSLTIKMIYHTINVTFTEAELFTIRYNINQATQLPNISQIIVITDSIHAAKRIFNSSSHPFQIHMSLISGELRKFFAKDYNNSIEFWDCPSHCKWALHNIVDKETKKFHLVLNYPYKLS